MGQLERYGLYVLVLVIFLILGVAIWGNDPQTKPDEGARPLRVELAGDDVGGPSSLSKALDGEFAFVVDELEDVSTTPKATPKAVPPVNVDPVAVPPTVPSVVPVVRDDPAPTPPAQPALREYKIREGDSLWKIAVTHLGDGAPSEIDRIVALNPGIDPARLLPGRTIQLPQRRSKATAAPATAKAAGASGAIHVVKAGENPSTIAQKTLGSQKYAKEIMEANGITDEFALREGMELVIPALRKD